MKHYHLILGLTLAAAALFSCGTNKAQVGVLTKPTSATTNVPGAEYPKINPDLSTVFRNDFPDAQSVSVNVGGKNYEMTKGEDGIWEATTEPLVPGFHYYTLTVDGERVSDPNSFVLLVQRHRDSRGRSGLLSGEECPARRDPYREV